jgi:hypothetical protein
MDRPDPPRPGQPPDGLPPPASGPLARLSAITGNAAPGVPRDSGNGATPARTLGRLRREAAAQLWATDRAAAEWLAENLDAIAEAASLDLGSAQLMESPDPVIVATLASGKPAVVVTQRGESTDDVFGALVRHVAATQAQHGVWICGEPANEHAAAISWLNRSVDGRFIMLRVGAVTIGDSAAAPTFEVAVRTPRADDPGVESAGPEADAPPQTGRRVDDWPGSERMEPRASTG